MNCNNQVIIKIIGKVSLEYPDIDQIKLRGLLEETLYKYDVLPTETALVASDIEEKLQIYLAVKKLEGFSQKTLKNYEYQLLIFASYIRNQ
jgi:integrase/recombinase XerD